MGIGRGISWHLALGTWQGPAPALLPISLLWRGHLFFSIVNEIDIGARQQHVRLISVKCQYGESSPSLPSGKHNRSFSFSSWFMQMTTTCILCRWQYDHWPINRILFYFIFFKKKGLCNCKMIYNFARSWSCSILW